MKKSLTIILLIILVSGVKSFAQDARGWWNSLSPAWKKIFQKEELKGKDVDPNDEQLTWIIRMTSLSCQGNQEITDLKPLRILTSLESLDCSNTNVTSLEGIENLTGLKYINCSNNDNISSLSSVSHLVYLEEINCGNTMVKDLTPLRNLHNLKKLDVHFCTVNNLTVISELRNLEMLDVSQNQSLGSIAGVEKMEVLSSLNCSETRISDITPLQNMKKLEYLNLSSTSITTIRPLHQVRTLKEIDCSNTNINALGLDYLYSHTKLTMLRARNIDITAKQIDDFISSYSTRNVNCDFIITPKK
ncbi:MAG: leucine-rich repeat domain-containing protein [Bacteroidales bacterium]|nr:leucine-rich repeat domain-containing protein [Bacteroidales bacterium]